MAMMSVAMVAFLRQIWLLQKYKSYRSRRGFSGCEMARQLLDRVGFPQFSVQAVKDWDRFWTSTEKQLLLDPKVYQGQSLYAIAETAKQVVLLSHSQGVVIPRDWQIRFRFALRFVIVPAWLLWVFGLLHPEMVSLRGWGVFLLGIVFLLGLLELSRDWEASQEAFELLKKTEAFEADEIIKLRHLLSALKLSGLAEIFKVPYGIVTSVFRKREVHGL